MSAAAKIIISKSSCSVSALLNEIPAYPRTSDFLSKSLGKGKRKFNQPLTDEHKPKVELQNRSTLLVEPRLSNGPEHRLTVHRMPEGDNTSSLQLRKVDEMADYMQRVASIFKNPSA